MLRTIPLQPPPGEWISYQVDELRPDETWNWGVAANGIDEKHPLPPARTVEFSDDAIAYRVIWVGVGGSKNMRIGERTEFDATAAGGSTYGGR